VDNTAENLAPALDAKTLLARINARITLLRSWISHDHQDEPYWWARTSSAPQAQQEREQLRGFANLLHVERATARGRVHGTRFGSLDEQRAWLTQRENWRLPCDVTLVSLRAR
jgi:hypothetical protein